MDKIKSYRDLKVWQKSHQLTKEIVQLQMASNDELKIIRNQLLRAAFSVPANIAEGYGGSKGQSFKNYLIIARRSLTETDYWLFLLYDLKFLKKNIYIRLVEIVNEINAMLNAIINKLEIK